MAGERIFVGVNPGTLYPQEGANFRTTQWGFDEGERRFLTHPNTLRAAYPQRNQRDTVYSAMYVTDVLPREHESGLIEITVLYKGLKNIDGTVNKEHILPGADAQMMSIGILDAGKQRTLLAQIPKNTCAREYVTTFAPDLQGVGSNYSGSFFPALTAFSITFVPDPDAAPPPKNYKTGWLLDSRSWDHVANSVFVVREQFSYYNVVGS